MAAIVVSSVLSIAVLLLVSGVTKLLIPDPGRNLFALLPLPEILRTSWIRRYLPWAEIVIAVGLVIGSGIVLWAATAASLVVFAVFTVFVVGAVKRGVPVPCGCFGRWSRAPMSWRTVVRNVVFTAVALLAFVVVSAGGYHGPVLHLPWWGLVALAVPLVMLGVLLWSERPGGRSERFGIAHAARPATPPVTRSRPVEAPVRGDSRPTAEPRTTAASGPVSGSHAPAADPAEPIRAGSGSSTAAPRDGVETEGTADEYRRSAIPPARAHDAAGRAVSLTDLADRRARCLVGLNPSIASDAGVLRRLENGGDGIGPVAVHVVISSPADLVALQPVLRAGTLVDSERDVARSLGAPETPWAAVLGTDGLLAGGPEVGSSAVLALLDALEERFGA